MTSLEEMDKKLEAVIQADTAEAEQIKKMLINSKERYITIPFLGEEVKVRPAIPKHLRHKIQEYYAGGGTRAPEEDERLAYEILAEMSFAPFDKAEVWALVDDETGEITNILQEVMEAVGKKEKAIKRFR
jgi:hypothetical protein